MAPAAGGPGDERLGSAGAAGLQAGEAPLVATRERIFVVEDNPANLLLAVTVMEDDVYAVQSAASAESARELIRKHNPDLILMDIQLPGMDGLEFTRELKASPETASIPVLALTAHDMPLYQRAAHAAGCEGFIPKPATPTVLSAHVRDFLDERGAERML
jgi:CheY-like chemotaxis protein